MQFNKKYILNVGLAFTLLFAGISIFLRPLDWIGFVPQWVENFGVSREFALQGHAVAEIVMGLWLLSNKKVRWVAVLAALDMASIIILNGFSHDMLLITFRDVGLLFMAIYLAVADEQPQSY
jgi:uncharacterized membrane protein YphA (DoxX/SURF4 family)